MRARRLLGIAAVAGVVAFAAQRDVHSKIATGFKWVKIGLKDLVADLSYSSWPKVVDEPAPDAEQKVATVEVETPRVVLDSPVVLGSSDNGITVAHSMGGLTSRTAPPEDHSGPVELVDEVDELPEK